MVKSFPINIYVYIFFFFLTIKNVLTLFIRSSRTSVISTQNEKLSSAYINVKNKIIVVREIKLPKLYLMK